MRKRPGEVMGLFAYGHPFLDGNGRTMLLVHLELSYRAGFSISWGDTDKANYLAALSREIAKPGQGILDNYLLQFKGGKLARDEWGKSVLAMKGLDGLDKNNQIEGDVSDPAIEDRYRQFERQRGYAYEVRADDICATCRANPCVCGKGDTSSAPLIRGNKGPILRNPVVAEKA